MRAPDSHSARLRLETREAHARVDALVGIDRPNFSVEDWRDYLRRLERVVRPLEAVLRQNARQWAAWLPDAASRWRAHRFADDLAALDVAPLPGAPVPATLCASTAACLGVLYVLEGSTLGARVVLKRLAHLGAPLQASSRAHLRPRVGAQWQTFCGALDAYGAHAPQSFAACKQAALSTFALFEASMT